MTPEIQKLLEDLRGQDVILRKQAAEQLGRLDSSHPEVVKALLDAGWDDDQEVAAAARSALSKPVHQEMRNQLLLQERPGFVLIAAIVTGLLAIPPVLMGIQLFGYLLSEPNVILLILFYWGGAVLFLIVAWGLWNLREWARIILLAILSLAVVAALVVGGFVGVIFLFLFGYLIYWLASSGEHFISKATLAQKQASVRQSGGTETLRGAEIKTEQPDKSGETTSEEIICRRCGVVNSGEREFCSVCLSSLKSNSSPPAATTILAYIIGGIGLLIGYNGLQEFLGDSNVLGLYYYIPLALVILGIAWGIDQAGKRKL